MADLLTPRARLPQTKGRMAQSLGLIAYQQAQEDPLPIPTLDQGKDIYNSAKDAITNLATGNFAAAGQAGMKAMSQTTAATQAIMSYKPLGAVFEFTINQSRQNRIRRGINSSMEGFGSMPGPITTTMKMGRAVLYQSDLMQAFNFTPGNIAFQTRPICVIEIVSKPGMEGQAANILSGKISGSDLMGALSNVVDLASMPIYVGCWFSESMISYKLTDNQLVIQDATLTVSRVSPSAAVALSALGLPGEQTLIESLPLVGNIQSLTGINAASVTGAIKGIAKR